MTIKKFPSSISSEISRAPRPVTPLKSTRSAGGIPTAMERLMDNAVSHQPRLAVEGGGKLTVELPVAPSPSFQARVLDMPRTPAEVVANQRSPFTIDGSASKGPTIDGVTDVGPDDEVELNAVHRFRLEPDDGQPVAFVGALIAQAVVERGGSQRTWVGMYRTRGGKVITEIVRDDGRGRNVGWQLGDRFRTVKVFDSVEIALPSIRSATLRNQLLSNLGLLKTKFID